MGGGFPAHLYINLPAGKATMAGTATTWTVRRPPAGALTTVWMPPSKCSTINYSQSEKFDYCYPPSYSYSYWIGGTGYSSPAICPSGVQPYYPGNLPFIVLPSSIAFRSGGPTTVENLSDIAPMIQVRWQSSDLSVLQTHPLSPGVTPPSRTVDTGTSSPPGSTNTGGTSTANAPGPANTGGNQPPEGGLSAGIMAAIVVGVVAVLAMAFAAWLFVKCRRRGARAAASERSRAGIRGSRRTSQTGRRSSAAGERAAGPHGGTGLHTGPVPFRDVGRGGEALMGLCIGRFVGADAVLGTERGK
ncbi:hypothetical protein GGTG_01903 [Gaeumannomyces tritici R3-111a-1]|uniref:Uncharacterized protein n=1 Tax=Gaeumannomyces tritici (strain R3-111a-1) TaxID=644352 RepID=J3NKW2_GAET3|nr:hypothetical protein GGTG_01903 [Gaeumannomyces tritici R3-111a-1]EJT81929.1 hypothetical protein GGTG_01903 [Gaeumannomyces tritici R3-111a-1]